MIISVRTSEAILKPLSVVDMGHDTPSVLITSAINDVIERYDFDALVANGEIHRHLNRFKWSSGLVRSQQGCIHMYAIELLGQRGFDRTYDLIVKEFPEKLNRALDMLILHGITSSSVRSGLTERMFKVNTNVQAAAVIERLQLDESKFLKLSLSDQMKLVSSSIKALYTGSDSYGNLDLTSFFLFIDRFTSIYHIVNLLENGAILRSELYNIYNILGLEFTNGFRADNFYTLP